MTLHEQVAQDLPLYALGTLTDDDRRSVEEHLHDCARCRFELHLLREDMTRLSLNGPDLSAFEEHPVARELPPMITLDTETVRTSPTRLYWLVAIPVVLCVILGAMVSQLRSQNAELSQQTSVSASELASERSHSEHGRMIDSILHDSTTLHFAVSASNAQIQVMFHPAMRRAVVIATRVSRPDPSKVYQLWMLPISGAPAISAGTFLPDANGSVFLVSQQLSPEVQFAGFEITAEEQGGSPAPTGTPVYTGK